MLKLSRPVASASTVPPCFCQIVTATGARRIVTLVCHAFPWIELEGKPVHKIDMITPGFPSAPLSDARLRDFAVTVDQIVKGIQRGIDPKRIVEAYEALITQFNLEPAQRQTEYWAPGTKRPSSLLSAGSGVHNPFDFSTSASAPVDVIA